jgi:general secretion pathway protein F/type IV pilus assembly protein PilC
MIANAEKTGGLARALQELARLIDRQLQMKKKLLGALLYPAFLGTFCLVVLGVLLFFVVPSLFDLFEGKELHSFTRFVFACSHFALRAKWFLAAALGCVISAAVWAVFFDQGKLFIKKLFLRFPGVRDLWAKIALARFFRASATLLEGGLPALFAMQQAGKTLRHPGAEKSMEEALRQIQEGELFEKALSGKMFIPPLIPRMLGIAQSGGSLPVMMHQIASIYEEDLEKSFTRITALAQPVLLLILGAMVGFVLLSVLLPLTDVSSFAA